MMGLLVCRWARCKSVGCDAACLVLFLFVQRCTTVLRSGWLLVSRSCVRVLLHSSVPAAEDAVKIPLTLRAAPE
jgi:hypothetical protein